MIDVRYHLSKIVPMPMHAHYQTLTDDGRPGPEVHVCDWWQWRGRVFNVRDRQIGWATKPGSGV